ncbi:MAG: F0F1 ATP synthase subunit B [Nitrospirae bacterium]|nr:F0F1 ATP synthase subunit B [Nitrospirota bacterium]
MRKSEVKSQKSKVKKLVTFLLFTVHCSLFTALAFAAEEGGHGEHAGFTWKDWFWPVINFAVLLFVLVYFTRKPFAEFFKNRTALIEKSLKEATEAKELAQKALNEVRTKLGVVDRDIDDIIASAKKAGEKEKEAIIAEGEKLKEKILEQAKANIDFELQKAKDKIKSEAAMMALELAEKHIKEKLGPKEQEALVDDYIKRLEAKN